jgi:hypothetical protein
MPAPFNELSGSPLETFAPDGMKANRRLICAWADRRALVAELLGGAAPANYPDSPNLVAVRIDVEPLADDLVRQDFTSLTEGLNAYQGFAKITVHYELLASSPGATFLPDVPVNTFLTYETDCDAQTVRVPGDALGWFANQSTTVSSSPPLVGVPISVFPAAAEGEVLLPVTIHRLAWHRVAAPPWTAIRECQGTLNADAFLGAAAGQLLFDGAKATRELLTFSDPNTPQFAWRLEYRFREKPLLLNTTPSLYATGDFSRLMQFEEIE